MEKRYTIEFAGWNKPEAAEGYNAWDFLPLPPEGGFASYEDAALFIIDNQRLPDADGVLAMFRIEEQAA